MKFLTAQYPVKRPSGISLVIQHYEYTGEQICFACIARQDDLSESLYQWFRREALGKLLKGRAGTMERAERSLHKRLRHLEKAKDSVEGTMLQEAAIAGILCKGEEFVAFAQGNMGILYLNTAFGKSHAECLLEGGTDLEIYSGRLEKDVAILLATGLFYAQMSEKWLLDGLFVEEMKQEWQMQKRLRELGDEVRHSGVVDVGGILVRSCEKQESVTENLDWVSAPEQGMLCGRKNDGDGLAGVRVGGNFRKLKWGRKVGQGAFSQVYRVQNQRTGEVYACKKSSNVAMLWREYCIGRELEHPLFPKMYDFWQENGCGFLLMEYVPGTNVKYLLERRAHFSVEQTIRVGMELAEGLLYLHEWKVPCLFRDVKPENIVMRQDGRVKLLDMGCVCAKDTQGDSRAGTPGFAAPEQFESGRVLDVTCDVYGVGKTLEAMLGCTKPSPKRRKQPGSNRMMGQGILQKMKKGRLRSRLKRMIRRCTEDDPRRRIPDMRILLLMLAQLLEGRYRWVLGLGKWVGGTVLYQEKMLCLKNIWDRHVETS